MKGLCKYTCTVYSVQGIWSNSPPNTAAFRTDKNSGIWNMALFAVTLDIICLKKQNFINLSMVKNIWYYCFKNNIGHL